MADQFDRERNQLVEYSTYAASICAGVAGLVTVFVPSAKLDFYSTIGKAFADTSMAFYGVGIPIIVTRGIIRGIRNRKQKTAQP